MINSKFIQNCQSCNNEMNSDTSARTPSSKEDVHGEKSTSSHFICSKSSQLDGTQEDTGTEGEFMKISRRKGRRLRRQTKRFNIRINHCKSLGGIENIFNYQDLYKAGKKCCNGVRWKQSVQNFELHLFSRTAVSRRAILNNSYKFSKYNHFILNERGKTRAIDAPRIQDRQVEKLFTQKVLLPLYLPHMVHNNGASLKGKGFHFSQKVLIRDLHRHYKKYGRTGGIIITDAKKFFPNANHDYIYKRHKQFILNDRLKDFADSVVNTIKGKIGMPLGVELSQAEMIAYPSAMDNYLIAQAKLISGHYMDDFYIIVPPDKNPKEIIKILFDQAKNNCFELNKSKTRYIPFTKPFKYCKTKFLMTESGKIILRANKDSIINDKRKIQAFYKKYTQNNMQLTDLWSSLNGMFSYLNHYNEHNKILMLQQFFYNRFGFSCEDHKNFN